MFYTRQLFKDKVYKLTFCLISFYCSEFPSSQIWYAASQFTYAVTKSWECQLKWILGGISFNNSKIDLWLMFHMAKKLLSWLKINNSEGLSKCWHHVQPIIFTSETKENSFCISQVSKAIVFYEAHIFESFNSEEHSHTQILLYEHFQNFFSMLK